MSSGTSRKTDRPAPSGAGQTQQTSGRESSRTPRQTPRQNTRQTSREMPQQKRQPPGKTGPLPKDALHLTLSGGAPRKRGITSGQIAVIAVLSLILIGLLTATLILFKPGKIQLWNIAAGTGGDTVIKRLDPPVMEEPVLPAETAAQAVKPVQEPEDVPAPGNRDTRIYFVKVNTEGQISLKSVNRSIDFSKAPLTQSINTLISGPGSDELNKGALTLIPEGSRLLSARVEGSTAYLNFNEDFRFNPLGREGYMAQLKQIVYTSTEFPGISSVQIMIEGVIREYLGGEGFYIGAPLSRESFQNNP